jgi:hypothetical protein
LSAAPTGGDRYGASQAENREKVLSFLNARSRTFEERPLLASYGGFSSSLCLGFPGIASKAEDSGTLVLAIPLEGDFAVETGLALIEKLEDKKNHLNFFIAFLGDEKTLLPEDIPSYTHKGLRDLLSLCDMPETWVLSYLDIDKPPSGFLIRHGNEDYIAPLDMIKSLSALFGGKGMSSSFEIRYNEIYKLGLAKENRPLALAWENEINGFCLAGVYDEGDKKKAPAPAGGDLAELLLEYGETLRFPIQNPDRHYFILPLLKNRPFFISEKTMVIFFISASALLVFSFTVYSAARRSRITRGFRNFIRYFWIFFILLPLLAAVLKGAGFMYSFLLSLLKASPRGTNYSGAGLTILLVLLLISLAAPLVHFLPIPRRANFFGFSAVILVVFGTLTSIIIDFTFLPVFIWASFFTFLGASLTNPFLILPAALVMPLQGLSAFSNIQETGSAKLAELLFSGGTGPGWITAFQLSILALPFLLLLEKGIGALLKGKSRISRAAASKYSFAARLALIGLVLVFMVIQILLIPPGPLPPVRRTFPDTASDILTISTENTAFEESRIIHITIEAKGNPLRFNLYLEGENLKPVYSSPAPYRQNGKSIEFILGENPPNPFKAEIVLPRDLQVSIRAEALYTQWESALDKEEEPDTEDYVFKVISRPHSLF